MREHNLPFDLSHLPDSPRIISVDQNGQLQCSDELTFVTHPNSRILFLLHLLDADVYARFEILYNRSHYVVDTGA